MGLGDCAHILSQPGRAQKIGKQNYLSWGMVHDYSRIIIFLWTIVWKKKKPNKMSLRCGQDFSQCCFSPPVQTDLLGWDSLSEDLGKRDITNSCIRRKLSSAGKQNCILRTVSKGSGVFWLKIFESPVRISPKSTLQSTSPEITSVSHKCFLKILYEYKTLTFFMESVSNKKYVKPLTPLIWIKNKDDLSFFW